MRLVHTNLVIESLDKTEQSLFLRLESRFSLRPDSDQSMARDQGIAIGGFVASTAFNLILISVIANGTAIITTRSFFL